MSQIRIHNQAITGWNDYGLLNVLPIVLNVIEAHSAEIHVCQNAEAANRRQVAALDGIAETEPMCTIAKDLQYRLAISAVRCGSETQDELRSKITKYPLVGWRGCVVRFIDDKVLKGRR